MNLMGEILAIYIIIIMGVYLLLGNKFIRYVVVGALIYGGEKVFFLCLILKN